LEDYSFHEQLPDGVTFGFEVSLFNDPRHLSLQSTEGWRSFYAVNNKHQVVDAVFHAHLENEIARSPYKSPFGSFEFSEEISLNALFHFIAFAETRLKARGANTIVIKNAPHDYNPHLSALLEVFLVNNGFQIVEAEAGSIIDVTINFEENLDRWEKRKIRGAQEAGLRFKKLPIDSLDEIYFFILTCRKKKNYALSMGIADVRKTVEQFPDRYLLFGVYQEQTLIAAAIAIRVSHDVLYDFYPAHDAAFDHLSPIVFLTQGMVHYAIENKMRWLDLGTSAIDDKPNFGLLDFKMRLGGKPTSKFTFRKNIS
jgi:hypothetical protein